MASGIDRSAQEVGGRWVVNGTFDAGAFHRDAASFLLSQFAPEPVAGQPLADGNQPVLLPLLNHRGAAEEERILASARRWAAIRFDAGYGWLCGPPELGGAGLPGSAARIFDDLEERVGAPDPSHTRTGIKIVGPTLERFGTAELKSRMLASVMRGDLLVCQLFSEPDAGSDLGDVKTMARSAGDDWKVTGQKVWSSGAAHADFGECLLTTIDPQSGERRLAMLVIDMHASGVHVRPIRQMTGASEFSEVFLDDVFVPEWALLGAPGDGWRIAMDTLNNERALIGANLLPARELVDSLIALLPARTNRLDAAGDLVMRAVIALKVSQLLADRLAGPSHTAEPGLQAMSKLSAAVSAGVVAEALSATIGMGLVASARLPGEPGSHGELGWGAFVLAVPGLRIGGGTDEILRNVVGERVLGLPHEPRTLARAQNVQQPSQKE